MNDQSDTETQLLLDKHIEMIREDIQELIHTLTHVPGKEMYDKVMLLVEYLVETGIDIVTPTERKLLVSLGELLVIRYNRERRALGFTPFISDKVYAAINFICNLPI